MTPHDDNRGHEMLAYLLVGVTIFYAVAIGSVLAWWVL